MARLARLLHAPGVEPDDALLLRQYIRLALAHAKALGYPVELSSAYTGEQPPGPGDDGSAPARVAVDTLVRA